MPDFDFAKLVGKKGGEPQISLTQDDDVNTDTEVLETGIKKCFKDLLVVRDYLRHKPSKVRRSLKSHKIWAPQFDGQLPMKTIPQKRFDSPERIELDFRPVKRRITC